MSTEHIRDKFPDIVDFFQTIFESSPQPMWVYDLETMKFLAVNSAAVEHYGYTHEEFLSMNVKEIRPPGEVTRLVNMVSQLGLGVQHLGSWKHRRKDGSLMDVEISSHGILFGGRKARFVIVQDVTERKKAEEALLQSERRYRQLFENMQEGFLIQDVISDDAGNSIDVRYLDCNPAMERFLGKTRGEIIGRSRHEVLGIPDPEVVDTINRVAITGQPYHMVRYSAGAQRWYESFSYSFGQGQVATIVLDITARKQAEEEIAERRAMLQQIMDTASVAISIVDKTGHITHANRRMGEMFGRTLEELIGTEYVELVHPSERETGRKNLLAMLANDIPFVDLERLYWRKDGTEFWGHLACRQFHDVHGNDIGLLGVITDISELKLAERKLRESEIKYHTFFESANDALLIVDMQGNIIDLNSIAHERLGYTRDEMLRMNIAQINHPSFNPMISERIKHLKEYGQLVAELAHVKKDGTTLPVEINARVLNLGGKDVIFSVVRDITWRKRMEEESLKAQKLESIGTLAGGIAHDFNNLLQGVFGYISMAKLTIDQKDKALAMLEEAKKALHQSVNLTTQLLTFSKGGKPVKKLVDLLPVIENSAKFTLSGSRSDLRLNVPEDLWLAEVDAGQLGQVIQNIVLNADQSMSVGSTVKVTAANLAKGDASLPPGLAPGDYVMIAIQDTGAGIPEQYLSKIFDPYFTTKEKGSGLGLATSYSIVRNHGGMIDVRTQYGEGTTFTIYLPALAGQIRAKAAESQQEPSQSRKAKILVMDDEEVIRKLSSELLSLLGHDVEVANRGAEALEKYQNAIDAGNPFDIVILDLTIKGGMGGIETVQQLLKMDPHVKAVVSSGYSDDAAVADYMSQGFKASLKKPYDVDALEKVLNKILNS